MTFPLVDPENVGTMEEDLKELGIDPAQLNASVGDTVGERVYPTGGLMQGERERHNLQEENLQEIVELDVKDVIQEELGDDEEFKDFSEEEFEVVAKAVIEEMGDTEGEVNELKKTIVKLARGAKARIAKVARRISRRGKKAVMARKSKIHRAKAATKKHMARTKKLHKRTKTATGKRMIIRRSGLEPVANIAEEIDKIVESVTPSVQDLPPEELDQAIVEHAETMRLSTLVSCMIANHFEEAEEYDNADALDRLSDKSEEIQTKLVEGELTLEEAEEPIKKVLSGVACAMEAYDELEEKKAAKKEQDEKPVPDKDKPDKDPDDEVPDSDTDVEYEAQCPKCESDAPKGSKFCPACGASLKKASGEGKDKGDEGKN